MIVKSFDKRVLQVVGTSPKFPFGFEERVVYSELVFMQRYAVGGMNLDTMIGFFEGTAIRIPSALHKLTEVGLAANLKKGVVALCPQTHHQGYFYRGTSQPWHTSFRYVTSYLPSKNSPLTFRELYLYAMLCSLSDRDGLALKQSKNGLVALTSIDRKTVVKGIDNLQSLNLITMDVNNNMLVHPLQDQHNEWLADKYRSVKHVRSIEDDRRRLYAIRDARIAAENNNSESVPIAQNAYSDTIDTGKSNQCKPVLETKNNDINNTAKCTDEMARRLASYSDGPEVVEKLLRGFRMREADIQWFVENHGRYYVPTIPEYRLMKSIAETGGETMPTPNEPRMHFLAMLKKHVAQYDMVG